MERFVQWPLDGIMYARKGGLDPDAPGLEKVTAALRDEYYTSYIVIYKIFLHYSHHVDWI